MEETLLVTRDYLEDNTNKDFKTIASIGFSISNT